jgi:azurin
MTQSSRLNAVIVLTALVGSVALSAQQRAAEPPARAITITVADPVDGKMTFTPSQITAKPGERLRITLLSQTTMPKLVMGHNFVLLKLGVDPKAFTDEAMSARDMDFIPAKRKADIITHTAILGPGEKEQVTFTVPKVAGKYPYVCSFAGHFAAGMSGALLVK